MDEPYKVALEMDANGDYLTDALPEIDETELVMCWEGE